MRDEDKKQPIDMTSDELLDYSIASEVAEVLKQKIRDEDPDCEAEG